MRVAFYVLYVFIAICGLCVLFLLLYVLSLFCVLRSMCCVHPELIFVVCPKFVILCVIIGIVFHVFCVLDCFVCCVPFCFSAFVFSFICVYDVVYGFGARRVVCLLFIKLCVVIVLCVLCVLCIQCCMCCMYIGYVSMCSHCSGCHVLCALCIHCYMCCMSLVSYSSFFSLVCALCFLIFQCLYVLHVSCVLFHVSSWVCVFYVFKVFMAICVVRPLFLIL